MSSAPPVLRHFPKAVCLLLAALATAQQPKHVAYPQRDALTPFRTPTEIYAPPDQLFKLLREMRVIADDPSSHKEFDADGREVVDDQRWRTARVEVERLGIDAGMLAAVMRTSKNVDHRATAFYGAFFCSNPEYVVNLISHIPGEPVRQTRQAAFPRALGYLRANLRRRFGDLGEDQKQALVAAMPTPGSPAARAAGIVRAPRDEDHLYELRLIPFFQLLDLDDTLDQAQGLWFLKEVFLMRGDLALVWLEPSLPRVRQLLGAEDVKVREQAIGLLQVIGGKDLRQAKVDEEPQALQAWADLAIKALFPPIRNINDTIVQLQPSPERDALVAAGVQALENGSIGDPAFGKTKDGMSYRGFRVAHVPDDLKALAIPKESVITSVNGTPVHDAASLLRTVREQLQAKGHPRRLLVEYVLLQAVHAVEYRVL